MSDENDDPQWAAVGKGLTISVVAVVILGFLWLVLHLSIYDPAFNDGFEAGRKSLYKQCFERSACPAKLEDL